MPKPLSRCRRWTQFSLGSMFAVITLFCMWLAVQSQRAEAQRKAVAAIEKVGGKVLYFGDPDPDEATTSEDEVSHESLVSKLVGKDFLHGVREVNLGYTRAEDPDLLILTQMPGLEELSLGGTHFTTAGITALRGLRLRFLDLARSSVDDDCLSHLRDQRGLKHLSLERTKVSDAGLVHVGHMRALTHLGLENTRVTGAGMEHLAGLSSLQLLQLCSTRVADDGLAHLSRIQSLSTLVLFKTAVSDAAVAHLVRMRGLKEIYVGHTKMTAAGVERLRKALPSCQVID